MAWSWAGFNLGRATPSSAVSDRSLLSILQVTMSRADTPVRSRKTLPSDDESRNLTRQAPLGSRHRPILIGSGSSEHHSGPAEPASSAKRLRRSARIGATSAPQPALPPVTRTYPATPRLLDLARDYPELQRYLDPATLPAPATSSVPAAPPMSAEELMKYPICEEFPELKEKVTDPMVQYIKLADGIVRARYMHFSEHDAAMEDVERELAMSRQRELEQRLRIESLEDEIEDLKDRYERRRR